MGACGAVPEFIDAMDHRAYALPEGNPTMMSTSFFR
jgi:hypothetical protein